MLVTIFIETWSRYVQSNLCSPSTIWDLITVSLIWNSWIVWQLGFFVCYILEKNLAHIFSFLLRIDSRLFLCFWDYKMCSLKWGEQSFLMLQNIYIFFFSFRVQGCLDWEVFIWELQSLQKHLVTFDFPKGCRGKQNGTGNSVCI